MSEITTLSTELIYHISLAEAKDQLGLTFSQKYDDTYIDRLIKSAHQECENIIQKDIARTSNVASIWDFNGSLIRIDKGNYNSITSVVDDTGATLTTDPSTLRIYPEYFTIELSSSSDSDPLTFTYVTGYDENQCPEIIKQAMLMKIGAYYDMERNGYNSGSYKPNMAAERLLNRYRSVAQLY